eukprot:6667616-Alexandrium_andersonii.AAC.1
MWTQTQTKHRQIQTQTRATARCGYQGMNLRCPGVRVPDVDYANSHLLQFVARLADDARAPKITGRGSDETG